MIAPIPITASATGHMRNAVLLPRTVVWLLPSDEPVVPVQVTGAAAEATSALSRSSTPTMERVRRHHVHRARVRTMIFPQFSVPRACCGLN